MARSPQVVLVTGAEGALGSVIVNRFLAAGCTVVGTTRRTPSSGSDRLRYLQVDLTDAAAVRTGLAGLAAGGVAVDALVHCAGGFRMGPLEDASDEDLDFLVQTNLRAALLVLRGVLGGMKARGHGRVVLVSSLSTLVPGANTAAYVASKAALNALCAALSAELRGHDVTVNAVLPGTLDTAANRRAMPGADHGTWVDLGALAELVFALTGPSHAGVRGALLPVPGGGG